MPRALFNIDLNLSKEYELWFADTTKIAIIFLFVHTLQSIQDPNRVFLNDDFVQALLFTVVGYSFYHLVWCKLVHFVHDDNDDDGFISNIDFFNY
jgi:hypothetical protein